MDGNEEKVTHTTMADQTTALWELIEPWLIAEQLELDDLDLVGTGSGRTLRVVVDGPDGVDLDRLADVSRGLSLLLDHDSDLEGSYQLEVTSPGLERRLRRPRQFEKSVGREVKIKARRGGTTIVATGILSAADADGFTVDTDDAVESFLFGDVLTARTVFRWERAPKPGKK